ncbi:MAG: hypothetical protein HFJ47_03730 [Clostridia bacterium]|nr:hypothetical protein [Clostridia bacterium]
MKIGIDIDGVLTDEHMYIIDKGTEFFYKNNIPYKIHKDIYDSKEIFEVSEKEYNNFWEENIFEYSKCISIRPFASEIINKLKKDNNEIHIITSRSFTTYENKYKDLMQSIVKQWLNKNEVKYDNIIFSKTKLAICKELKINVMIEDKPENIEEISKYIPVICYDHPYNQQINGINIIRCYSWYDIYDKIQSIQKNYYRVIEENVKK